MGVSKAALTAWACAVALGCVEDPDDPGDPPVDAAVEQVCHHDHAFRPCGVLHTHGGWVGFIGLEYGPRGELIRESVGQTIIEHSYGPDGCRTQTTASTTNRYGLSIEFAYQWPPLEGLPPIITGRHLLLKDAFGLDWLRLSTDTFGDRTASIDLNRREDGQLASQWRDEYQYSADGELTGRIRRDWDDRQWTSALERDDGRIVAMTSGEYVTRFDYDAQGRVVEIDEGSRVKIFEYRDDAVRLTVVVEGEPRWAVELHFVDGHPRSVCADGFPFPPEPSPGISGTCQPRLELLDDCSAWVDPP